MKKWHTALGFYQNPKTAETVLKKLKKSGLKHVALIRRSHEGKLSRKKPLLYRMDEALFEYLEEKVISDENLVVVQIEASQTPHALKILRHVESGHPISFLLRSAAFEPFEFQESDLIKEPLSTQLLQERAKAIAYGMGDLVQNPPFEPSLLKRLDQCARSLNEIRNNVSQAEHIEQTITSSAEWLLDNMHVIQSSIEEVRRNLPKKYYRELPKVKEGPFIGLARIYLIAKDLIYCTANRLTKETIVSYIQSYQQVNSLTIGELWALPLMLRLRLIESVETLALHIDRRLRESEFASFWGNRLLNVAKREPERLADFLQNLKTYVPNPSSYFAEELLEHLFDEETILPLVKAWFEEYFGKSINEILHAEQILESIEQVGFSNAMISLISLSQLSWREIFESLCMVDKILNNDPVGAYSQMDFLSRDQYRHVIEKLAKKSKKSEIEVALVTLKLSERGKNEVERHVGYYLINASHDYLLEKELHYKSGPLEKIGRFFARNGAPFYLSAIFIFTLLLLLPISAEPLFLLILAIIPMSEIVIQLLNATLSECLTPHTLPKISLEKGIPEEYKTLIVVPTLLTSVNSIKDNIKQLEINYLANAEPALRFGIFFDFCDSIVKEAETDFVLLQEAINGFQNLTNKYGDVFFLFIRERSFSRSEDSWIGWERKRGKLESLNRFLMDTSYEGIDLKVGRRENLHAVKYVITLDADTQLPKNGARKLIETIIHPLNKARFSPDGYIERGYSILQPRVNTHFANARQTYFSRIFSESSVADPYSHSVSDLYQDLTHEGSYHGKGIYDVEAVDRILYNHFPEEHILSHDLIEGCYTRVGFTSDICLLDLFPEDYIVWSQRRHRWMRGDWQNIDWLFAKVPNRKKKKVINPLSAINRWKIFDNLRRALLPLSLLLLLLCGWFFTNSPALWTLLSFTVLFMPTICLVYTNALIHPSRARASLRDFGISVSRSLINASTLVHQAYLSIDALARVIYRRLISKKHFLQWSKTIGALNHKKTWIQLSLISAAALALTVYLANTLPYILTVSWPFLILWIGSPFLIALLDQPFEIVCYAKLSESEQQFIRHVARKTWRYFSDFVGPETSWLPPDNYQAALNVEIAERTSPTNIGLWLLTVVAAHDFGYITIDDAIDKISRSLDTLKNLETFEGHLLNWYDTRTLKSLHPRYVSAVDSGNFLASLWTLEQALHELMNAPLLPLSLVKGLRDTAAMIEEDLPIKEVLAQDPQDLNSLIALIKSAIDLVNADSSSYWIKQLHSELQGWLSVIDRYFGFVPENQLVSLKMLSEVSVYEGMKEKEAIERAKWFASEKLAQAKELIEHIVYLSNSMNMRFLYNEERKLFSIGYNVEDRRLDSSHYDLLASEARVASLVAIAKGDVPVEHWWALGRSYKIVHGQKVLLSWGGTMFEYLMPLLFNPYFSESLLGEACTAAVNTQIRYGEHRGMPWGISESAYSDIDVRRTYQYKSFGVPGLGFKRDLEDDLVVSPYSTALALTVSPSQAVQNLKRLQNVLADYGYYESIDYTRQHGPHGERGVVVYAFMAHHQAMSFLSFDNVLFGGLMVIRFHKNPRIAGIESLLYELPPVNPPIARGFRKEVPVSRLTSISTVPIMGIVDTPHSLAPKVNLLSNGKYSVMVTNSGGGYSRWKDFDITRWRADTTQDSWGSFCYIKELQSGTIASVSYQPVLSKGRRYSVSFKADKVEIKRRDETFETTSDIVVSPEDDAEIRLISLVNLSHEAKTFELTSYQELALSLHAADRQHPCFNKLFIQTQALEEDNALLAFRRLRSDKDQPLWAGHVVASNEPLARPIQYETSRFEFIGRGKCLERPQSLHRELSKTTGYVLDPIFSIRYTITLQAGQRAYISFITAIAEDREKIVALIQKYTDINASFRAKDVAWTHAQLELRHLRIHQEEAQLFQKLASRILYPHSQLRPSADRLCRNRRGQSHLWAYGISGDLPIVVVSIADIHELDLVKQTLIAHTFWNMRGLKTDLVILNDEMTGYEHPLFEQLRRLITAHSTHTEFAKPGGVYLLNSDQIPEEDILLIHCVARVHLIAARGSLRQQVVSPMEATTYPSRFVPNKKAQDVPSRPLSFMDLLHFNGLGGFSQDTREYVLYLGPEVNTPLPWINVIANEQFGTLVSEAGIVTTWFGNSQTNRLTPWANDPIVNPIADSIYIRDEDLGTFWTVSCEPVRERDPYRVRHGQGYTIFEHNSHGIDQELVVFVPVDLPLRIQKLSLTNSSSKVRTLSVTSYSEMILGTNKEETEMHVISEWDPESQAIFACNRYNPDYPDQIAFSVSIPHVRSFTADRCEFLGRNGKASNPAAMKRKTLAGLKGAALDPCAALQVEISLKPGETKQVVFVLGVAQGPEKARELIHKCREEGFVQSLYNETVQWWKDFVGTMQIQTPEEPINTMVNSWLLYQNLSCRFWGRSAFYQSSGAYGFRDQLQDCMAFLYTAPYLARKHILKAASHQFEEGDVQHWWHPPANGGVRTKISDDLLWLPFVTAQYIRVTQDTSILDEMVPFIKGELLKEDQEEAYIVPEVTEEKATLLEHCRRAVYKGLTSGPHGLPLIGSGDWNDGMNQVGVHGKGESVWLGWFLIQVMNDFAELIEISQPNAGEGYRNQAKRLSEVVNAAGWDGEWYRRAYMDDGAALGSKENDEDKIDSLSQSWSVISQAGDPEKKKQAMEAVEKNLIKKDDRLVLLLTPPFDKTSLNPGYIKGYPPGVRENGGQYTHGSLWVPLAFARLGEGDKAVDALRLMLPLLHAETVGGVERYKVEPYVLAGDVYNLPGAIGRGGWSWYTGSAAWMYRIFLEEIIGFTLRGTKLSFTPCLASHWQQVRASYRYKSSLYDITIKNPEGICRGQVEITLDEQVVPVIELADDGKTHQVSVLMRS